MQDTAGETRTNSLVTYFYGPLYMDAVVKADKQELKIFSVQSKDVI